MQRILVFGMTDNPGGVESVIMNYYRKIDKTKIQFDFLCNTDVVAYEDEIIKMGGKIFRVTARSKNRKKFHEEMHTFFKENAKYYNTIWVNVCSLANIDYLKFAKKYGIKYRIIHSHNSQNMDSFARKMVHKINRNLVSKYATDFWACSDEAAKWFYKSSVFKKNDVLIIHNAIDLKKFSFSSMVRNEYRKELECDGKLVIGHVGRFHFQKNQNFLIDIFAELKKINPDSLLLLIGQGEDEQKICDKVNELKLENSVKFLGVRQDVEKLMQCMDVFAFPSLFEGLPLVLLEAQAVGIPIVASSDVIPNEACMSKNFEFVSLNQDAKFWAERIIKLYKEYKNHNLSKENMLNITRCDYNIDVETQKLEKFFERN